MSLRKHFKFSIFMISFMTDSTADLVQLLKSNSKKKEREEVGLVQFMQHVSATG